MAHDESRRSISKAVTTSVGVISLMIAVFTLLDRFMSTSLVQPIGALVFGLILTIILVWMGVSEWRTAFLVWLGMGLVLLIVHLIVSRPVVVVGKVVDRNGAPLGNLVLVLRDSGGTPHEVVTDEEGGFEVRNVPEGEYTISVEGQLLFRGAIPSGWKRLLGTQQSIGTLIQEAAVVSSTPQLPATATATLTPSNVIVTVSPFPTDTPSPMPTVTITPSSTPISTPVPTTKILEPKEGEEVDTPIIVRGVFSSIPAKPMWIIVVPQDMPRYYPQDAGISMMATGEWTATNVWVGLPRSVDVGKKFVILVALVGEQGNREFESYLEGCRKTGQCPGLESLPLDVELIAQVMVVRK